MNISSPAKFSLVCTPGLKISIPDKCQTLAQKDFKKQSLFQNSWSMENQDPFFLVLLCMENRFTHF